MFRDATKKTVVAKVFSSRKLWTESVELRAVARTVTETAITVAAHAKTFINCQFDFKAIAEAN